MRIKLSGWRYDLTPLSLATGQGHEAVVRLLIGRDGVNIDAKDNDGSTPPPMGSSDGA